MEASQASLKAHFTAVLLHNDFLALVLLIRMVQLRNLPDNPERLAVKLLFKIGIKKVSHLVFVAYDDVRKQISQRRREIFNTLGWLTDELLQLFVDLILDRRAHLYQHRENAIKIDQPADRNDRTVLRLIDNLNHMSDDQLWHNFKHHTRLETLTGATLSHVANSMLKQVHESFVRVHGFDLSFVLLGLIVEHLLLDFVRLLLAEIKRKPVSEPLFGD